MSTVHADHEMATASATLTLLNKQAEELRAHLATLRRSLADVQRDFSESRAAQLKEANEKLVLAVVQADMIAESAVSHLDQLMLTSQRDAVTGMPNRGLILDRLDNAIALARRHGTHIAVAFLDLDHFKPINDLLGHASGDQVLQLVARRLQSAVRDSDTVSRYGGDEFLVLLTEVSQPSDAALIAEKMLSALAMPSVVGTHRFQVSASVGIAIYPEDGEDAQTLIDQADAAMYRVKRGGGANFDFHRADLLSNQPSEPYGANVLELPLNCPEFLSAPPASALHLREANEQLVIATLTAQASASDAQQAHHRQIKFMAMVAHELRNPLAPIQIAAGMLTDRSPTEQISFERLRAIIESQVAHMSRLIEDLLEGSRISTGKLRLERSVVDLVSIVALAVATCQPAMDARLQRLHARLPPGPIHFYGDSVRLRQIFSNLLDNASKYTPAGGAITLVLDSSPQAATITIADNGIGIAAESLPTIFDLFERDKHTSGSTSGGLGIGLAVVRDLVEAHGGTVVGTSAGKNLGSEFVVTLPLWLKSPTLLTD